MKNKSFDLREMAHSVGLSAGVARAEPTPHLEGRLRRRLAEKRTTPFEEPDPARRVAPARLLAGCRSIVVLGMPYSAPEHPLPASPGSPRGEVARCARGMDYHLLLEHKAAQLAGLLKQELPAPVNYRILVDRNPLVEREMARLAGLGRIGENCTLITPDFGSHVALGTILLDCELPAGIPLQESCRGCGLCREACPTGALAEPYILDPFRCLSYLTQAPGVVPAAMRTRFGNRLYGCDRCQEVCPLNRGTLHANCPGTTFSFFPGEPLLLPLLRMTRREFQLTIGRSAAGWRGKTTLQRNAVIALGNLADETAVAELGRILETDRRPLLRLHAAWALGQLGGARARRYLEISLKREPDSAVIEEARQALEQQVR